MKPNIIFLDIDGVLNHHMWYEKIGGKKLKDRKDEHLDPDKIKLINTLCKDANCKVVISSTWRIGFSIEKLQDMMNYHKANFEIIDKTGKCCSAIRGVEIYNW